MIDARGFSFSGRLGGSADKAWLVGAGGEEIRYADLAARGAGMRRAVAAAGGGKGEVVAVVSADPAEIVAALLACWAEGKIAAVMDPATPGERWRALRGVLGFGAQIGAEPPDGEVRRCLPEGPDPGGAEAFAGALDRADRGAAGLILFSSGTTGTPKCIPLSPANLLANAEAVNRRWGIGPGDVFLCTSPAFYAHGLYNSLFSGFFAGGTVLAPGVLNPMGAAAAFGLAAARGATVYHLTPTMAKIANLVAPRLPALPRFRLAVCGTAAFGAGDRARFEELFGVRVVVQYGMTESLIMASDDRPGGAAPGSVGWPLGCDLLLLDREGRPVAEGEEGEIAVRSPSAFGSYFNQPEETASAYREGLFFTGDLGRFDAAGALAVTGRIKELIKKGGANISPAEIERALLAVEGVREAAVVGVPDPVYGEEIAAFVAGERLPGEGALRESLARALPRSHQPRWIARLDALPRTASGKVATGVLRELQGFWF